MAILTQGASRTPCDCPIMLPARALRGAVAKSGFVQVQISEFSG